jgi:hypothetical protein
LIAEINRLAKASVRKVAMAAGVPLIPATEVLGDDVALIEKRAKAQAGTINVDVVYISDAPVVVPELLAAGIITPFVPPRVADRVSDELQTPLLARRLSTKELMYDEKAFKNGSPITNLWQLTIPDWKGKGLFDTPCDEVLAGLVIFLLAGDFKTQLLSQRA